MRVLLVEDDLSTARGMVLMLKSAGMVVDQAETGEEAVELSRLYDYDIVVLDLILPDMEGYEVVRRMRAARQATPVPTQTAARTRPRAPGNSTFPSANCALQTACTRAGVVR